MGQASFGLSTIAVRWPRSAGSSCWRQESTRAEILEQLWGYPPRRAADLRVVDVYVARLRGKLEPDPRNPELILTVRGTGYASQRMGENAPMAAAS